MSKFMLITALTGFLYFSANCGILSGKPVEDQKKPRYSYQTENSSLHHFADSVISLASFDREKAVDLFLSRHKVSPLFESDSVFSLFWYGKADRVLVAGDLQSAWTIPDTLIQVDGGINDLFYISYKVPPDTRLDYEFVIDSVYATDPANPVIVPSGYGPHSQLSMLNFVSDPVMKYNPSAPHGTLDSLEFTSRNPAVLSRMARIYLPAGYEHLSDLPVLYVLDGLEAMEYMKLPVVLDNLIADKKIVPIIAVFLPPSERHTEYLGEKYNVFLEAFCNEFTAQVDQKYNSAPKSSKRAVAGISSGGHLALISVLLRHDVFQMGAGQSPTLSANTADALKKFAKRKNPEASLKLYIDCGRFDLLAGSAENKSFLEATDEFCLKLGKAGVDFKYSVVNDGHEWASWRERTDEILLYFFGR